MAKTKQEISGNFTKAMQTIHLPKPYPENVKAFITGADNKNSIGQSIKDALNETGSNCVAYNDQGYDVTTVLKHGQLSTYNALIMCHGATHLDWIEDVPDEKIRQLCDVNLYGTINVTKTFVNDTIHAPVRKKIIYTGSMAYKAVLNASATYCASKAGAAHFMRCMAWELAPKGYDVYCIHPSNVDDSPMAEETIAGLARYRHMSMEDAKAYWGNEYIRGRSLTKHEIVALVKFLLTPAAEFLSGQQFEFTGGQR